MPKIALGLAGFGIGMAGYPAAPSNLVAQVTGSDEIWLTWTDNSTDETGFSVERGTDGLTFAEIGTVGAGVTEYTNTGLSQDQYYYRVRAYRDTAYSNYSNVDDATIAFLIYDVFTTPDPAPIASPRNCEPGPGKMINVDTASKMSISGNKIICTGGKATPAWGDPSAYFTKSDTSGLPRGTCIEFTYKTTTIGYIHLGVSNSTTMSDANAKHPLFVIGNQRWALRDVGSVSTATTEEYAALHLPNVTYTLRLYVLTGGGCLWLIKGGQFGTSWRALGYSTAETDSTVYPLLLNYSTAFEYSSIIALAATPKTLYRAYWNGRRDYGSPSPNYQIGTGVSPDGISIARDVLNPVLSFGTTGQWDDNLIKDPWVLKDGSTWKMWYSGHDGSKYRIGYATSPDGRTWTKSGSNPVLDLGAGGQWDANGVCFPIVYKDNAADASKRWKMLYAGINASGVYQIGYAYSSDGVNWNRGAANPVVTIGAPGEFDDVLVYTGTLIRDDSTSTFYLFYDGRPNASFPVDDQVGLVTFTDWEGAYTKSASNPVLNNRTGTQALTANLNAGSTTVQIGDTSVFLVGEYVLLCNTSGKREHNRVASITDGTHLELVAPVSQDFTTATGSKLNTAMRAVPPRCAVKEGNTWKMWIVPFHNGIVGVNSSTETSAYAVASDPEGPWTIQWGDTPPLHLPAEGWDAGAWDSTSAENVVLALDADTMKRVRG